MQLCRDIYISDRLSRFDFPCIPKGNITLQQYIFHSYVHGVCSRACNQFFDCGEPVVVPPPVSIFNTFQNVEAIYNNIHHVRGRGSLRFRVDCTCLSRCNLRPKVVICHYILYFLISRQRPRSISMLLRYFTLLVSCPASQRNLLTPFARNMRSKILLFCIM